MTFRYWRGPPRAGPARAGPRPRPPNPTRARGPTVRGPTVRAHALIASPRGAPSLPRPRAPVLVGRAVLACVLAALGTLWRLVHRALTRPGASDPAPAGPALIDRAPRTLCDALRAGAMMVTTRERPRRGRNGSSGLCEETPWSTATGTGRQIGDTWWEEPGSQLVGRPIIRYRSIGVRRRLKRPFIRALSIRVRACVCVCVRDVTCHMTCTCIHHMKGRGNEDR